MKHRVIIVTALFATVFLITLFSIFDVSAARVRSKVLAASTEDDPLDVITVHPASAPNDFDTPIVITGTGFTAELSGTLVITPPVAILGETTLADVTWVSSITLEAIVPWGMNPGAYTLTVTNPDGATASFPNPFTITQAINTWTTGGPYGGIIRSLVLGDQHGEIVYALVPNVGLFRSQDGGERWELIFAETGWVNRVAVDPTNPNRLYITKQAPDELNLYRSEDSGDTWNVMPHPLPDSDVSGFYAYVNPHNGTLFCAFYVPPGVTYDGELGLFRFDETMQTWTRLEKAGVLEKTSSISALGFDPHDPDILYAGLVGGQVLKSIDGGETWSYHSESPIDYIKELVVNPVGGELWVCGPLADGAQKPGGLYRYAGADWVSMYSSPYHSDTVGDIIFDPAAPYSNSQKIWISALTEGVLKSEDGGQNWIPLITMQAEALALNPAYSQTLYGGSIEGVAKTDDGGTSWQTINQGITGIIPYHMGISPYDPAVVFGVADSIGILGSQNGGATWQRRTASTGGPIVVDPVDPLHVVNADYGVLHIADDGWNFSRDIPISLPLGMSTEDYSVIPNAMIARSGLWLMGVGYGNKTLPYWNYEGGGSIYLSADGEDWTWVDALLDCPPTGLAFDPVDDHTMYAITSGMRGGVSCDGAFLRSTDNGQTWQKTKTGLGNVIAVEPVAPYRIFDGCSVSEDQGVTWHDLACPGNVWANSLLFVGDSPPVLFAGTGIGLFQSIDGAQTWQRAQGAMGQMEIWSMAGTTLGERQILYVTTVGGVADGSSLQSLAGDVESLVNAGVYRFTMLPLQRVFLPVIMR
jgi:photosystem II stability/assembly factor-like uncharacterized protein